MSSRQLQAGLSVFQMAGMLGLPDTNSDEMTQKLEEMLPIIKQVNEQFKDPVSSNH